MNHAAILELLLATLPYPNHIANIDLTQKNQVRLDWHGAQFKVSDRLTVEEVKGRLLESNRTTMLMEHLIQKENIDREARTIK